MSSKQPNRPDPAHNNSLSFAFSRLWEIIRTLRGPYGCPWDLEQTTDSLKHDVLEEAFEVLDSINADDRENLKEELGDVLLLLLLITRINEQDGAFALEDVLEGVCEKLIRRHPHVFGDAAVEDTDGVRTQWENIKQNVEGRRTDASALDSVPAGMPPLERAFKLQKKAAKAGFDWPSVDGAVAKLHEEVAELDEELGTNAPVGEIGSEIGDVLFSVINICRHTGVNPSDALDRTNRRFGERFRSVEAGMKAKNMEMKPENLAAMEALWQQAKKSAKTASTEDTTGAPHARSLRTSDS